MPCEGPQFRYGLVRQLDAARRIRLRQSPSDYFLGQIPIARGPVHRCVVSQPWLWPRTRAFLEPRPVVTIKPSVRRGSLQAHQLHSNTRLPPHHFGDGGASFAMRQLSAFARPFCV